MLIEHDHFRDIPGMAVTALAEDGFMSGGPGLTDELLQRRADRAVLIDGEHGTIDDAEGSGDRPAGILVHEGLTFLERTLGVVVHDDPERIALGAR